MAFGLGLLNGLRYTFTRIAKTYAGDLRHLGRSHDPKEFARRQSVRGDGIFTAQYPAEKVPVAENFRFIPFLVYEPKLDESGKPLLDAKTGKEVICVERCNRVRHLLQSVPAAMYLDRTRHNAGRKTQTPSRRVLYRH